MKGITASMTHHARRLTVLCLGCLLLGAALPAVRAANSCFSGGPDNTAWQGNWEDEDDDEGNSVWVDADNNPCDPGPGDTLTIKSKHRITVSDSARKKVRNLIVEADATLDADAGKHIDIKATHSISILGNVNTAAAGAGGSSGEVLLAATGHTGKVTLGSKAEIKTADGRGGAVGTPKGGDSGKITLKATRPELSAIRGVVQPSRRGRFRE